MLKRILPLLLVLLLCAAGTALADDEPTITITPAADAYSMGSLVHMRFSVTGGAEPYQSINTYWTAWCDYDWPSGLDGYGFGELLKLQEWDPAAPAGTVSFQMADAYMLRLTVDVVDANGEYYSEDCDIEFINRTLQPGAIDTLYLPAGLTEIGEAAFESVAAQMVVIPNGCTTIGPGAFADSEVRVVVIPASVTEIDDTAFDGLDETLCLRDPSHANPEVERIVELLCCCYTTYMPYDIAQ